MIGFTSRDFRLSSPSSDLVEDIMVLIWSRYVKGNIGSLKPNSKVRM